MSTFPITKLKKHSVKIGSGITPKGGETAYKVQGIPLIRSQNVLNNRLSLSSVAFIDKEQHKKMSGSKVLPGDVLLNITGASIGRSCVVPQDVKEANVNQHVCIIRLKQSINGRLLSLYLNSWFGQKQIWSFQGGGSREALNFQQIGNFDIPLPPLPEQKAIADLLSTWDKAIEKTERLIQAKERRFKWLLRELISEPRKTRKDAKWKKVKLGEVCEVTMGSSPSSKAYNEQMEGIPLLQGKADLKNRKSEPRIYTTKITKICEVGDLLMSVRAPVGYISISQHRSCIGRGIAAITVKEGYNRDFVFYSLLSLEYKWKAVSQGGTFEAVSGPEVKAFTFRAPSLELQSSISDTLNASQHEIDLLKQLADKYKTQKRGLMQKMLTGEWRVKPDVVKQYGEV